MRIALDAMGGDLAPREAVLGALQASEMRPDDEVLLVGPRAIVEDELTAAGQPIPSNVRVIHAPQTIGMDEKPVEAIKKKPDNSILRAIQLVASGEAGAAISAGNTGAMVAAATLCLKPIPGVRRAGIAITAPSATGHCTLMDVGANLSCKPTHLCQYGIMASLYHAAIYKVERPRVGLLNVGEEDTKGGPIIKEAAALMANAPIHFIGNAEGRDIFNGKHDVVVCDGFVGNAIIKAIEGYGEMLADIVRTAIFRDVWGRLSFNLMRPVLLNLERKTDFADYGGGLLLGVEGGVVICHGRSNARAICNAILKAFSYIRNDVSGLIRTALNETSSVTSEKE
jgi:glycerol-3-phosphate acyltransferase PlsX